MQVRIETTTALYETHDDRQAPLATELLDDLRSVGAPGALDTRQEPGTKGVSADAVILALGTAGVFTAAVEAFKAWLGRDKQRSLTVRWTADGEDRAFSIDADDVDEGVFNRLAETLARSGG